MTETVNETRTVDLSALPTLAQMVATAYATDYAAWTDAVNSLKSSSASTEEKVTRAQILEFADAAQDSAAQDYRDLVEAAKSVLLTLRQTYAPGTAATEDDAEERAANKAAAKSLKAKLQETLKFGEMQSPGFTKVVEGYGPLPLSASAASGTTIRRPRIQSATMNGERIFNTGDASARPRFSDIVLKIKGLTGTAVDTSVLHAAWSAAAGVDNTADITDVVTFPLSVAGPGEGKSDFEITITPLVSE